MQNCSKTEMNSTILYVIFFSVDKQIDEVAERFKLNPYNEQRKVFSLLVKKLNVLISCCLGLVMRSYRLLRF